MRQRAHWWKFLLKGRQIEVVERRVVHQPLILHGNQNRVGDTVLLGEFKVVERIEFAHHDHGRAKRERRQQSHPAWCSAASGVATSSTESGPYPLRCARCVWDQRMEQGWTMPLGIPVVPDE